MASISEFIAAQPHTELTEKQQTLINACDLVINGTNLVILVNEPFPLVDEAISIDIEHDEFGEPVCVGLYVLSSNTCYSYTDLQHLRNFNLRSLDLIAHNGRTDLELLEIWGCAISPKELFYDTQLMGHIQDSSLKAYGLKAMAERDLGIVYPSYDDIVGKKTAKSRVTLDKQPIELCLKYNALDCMVTGLLYQKQGGRASGRDYYSEIEAPLSLILLAMESRGIRVSLEYLEALKGTLEALKEPLEQDILNELGPINLNSPKQLLGALNAKEIYPELKGKPSTDKRALERLKENPIIQQLLSFSETETLLSSFVYPYLERGQSVVHPFYNQTGTRTGRLSCSNPNLLQIPTRSENGKLVRRMFIPREGFKMGDCDFGQIEPRLLAHLSKDREMLEMFNRGVDFHTFTSDRLQIDRTRAKVLNLSVGYRATYKSVSAQLKSSETEAQTQIDQWWNMFPGLRRWQDKLIWESKRSGFFTTLFGRRIKVEGLDSYNKWKREAAERQLINNIAQASAREVMVKAMININGDFGISDSFGLLVQVYDELLFESQEVEEDMKLVIDNMINCVKLDVPLTVEGKIGLNWAEAH